MRHLPSLSYSSKNKVDEVLSLRRDEVDDLQSLVNQLIKSAQNGQQITEAMVQNAKNRRNFDATKMSGAFQEQRSLLLGVSNTISASGASLSSSEAYIEQGLAAGAAAHTQLQSQREQFIEQRETLRQTDSSMARSKRTLMRIRGRIAANKLIQAAIIIGELGVCGLIVYLKYYM